MPTITVSDKRDVLKPYSVSFDERALQLEKQAKAEEEARKREKNSPFTRWTQFNLEHTKELMWLALKHPKAHAILYFLVDQMDEYNAVMCSTKVLEEVLGISRQTISKNITLLKENGFIAVLKSGTSNVYTINDKVYWKTSGNKQQYSKFPANVVLSMSEQDEFTQMEFKDLGFTKIKEVMMKGEK
jgi:DNA-binding transcriptional ArsR family regulator